MVIITKRILYRFILYCQGKINKKNQTLDFVNIGNFNFSQKYYIQKI